MVARAAQANASTRLQRRLVLLAGFFYGGWWFTVNWLLPAAFNPIGSRAAVVLGCAVVWGLSHAGAWGERRLPTLMPACIMAISAHYFYLFYFNSAALPWVVGAYITITASCATLITETSLAVYGGWVLLLSAILTREQPGLGPVFLPGVMTVLLAAFVALRLRFRLIAQLQESAERIAQLYHAAQQSEAARIQSAAAQEAQRVREEYVMILAHELKTPVTAIKLRTQMMLRSLGSGTAVPPEKIQRFVQSNSTQADRLAALVEEMLDVSRIQAGKLAMHKTRLDLTQLVEDTVHSFEDVLEAGARLTLRTRPEVFVEADRFRLEQVVLNLLANALKYGRGTPVEVHLDTVEGRARLQVRDFGMGIAAADLERVFQRFERAVSARDISGLGLGLYICREIVEAHQGSITVQSAPNAGATFCVVLPLAAEPPGDSRPAAVDGPQRAC